MGGDGKAIDHQTVDKIKGIQYCDFNNIFDALKSLFLARKAYATLYEGAVGESERNLVNERINYINDEIKKAFYL
jgi:hypothetical protein